VNAIAWTLRTRSRNSCKRISGVVSMSRLPRGKLNKTLGRVRWFRGSLEVQTGHSHPIMGTPLEVPLPRKISRRVSAASCSINRLMLRGVLDRFVVLSLVMIPELAMGVRIDFGKSHTSLTASSGSETLP